ncbi:hypothetical protein BU17DRAFT_83597 [Hysterangium stoloniferum]|nr:hypothetical protein BU17DRAFT_83597 [Hysterangium stoloniferum]
MRIRSSSPPTLSLAPLPPTPAPSATTPVSPTEVKREPTPFDELPMSHLISFPINESPTEDSAPFDAFHTVRNPFSSYPASSSLLRDAFDYYRLPNSNPTPISDALNMSIHGGAFKPQVHSHTMPDLSNAFSYPPSTHPDQQQQQQQQQCIPTSHLFSNAPFPTAQQVEESPSPSLEEYSSPIPMTSTSQEDRQSQPPTQKKRPPRAAISTKDFVPPDVSGLSKREARLVKNRAAAFLSRQRKREEFDRVAELEQENARLLALTQSSSRSRSTSPPPSQSSRPAKSDASPPADAELASLRSLLAQSRARAAELEREVACLRTTSSTSSASDSGSDAGSPGGVVQVKRENGGTDAIPKRTGASLFGVVLLCALPSLLTMPAPSVPYAASRFSYTPGPGASVQPRSQAESLLDWPGMDIDDSESGAHRKVHLPLSFINGQNDFLQNFVSVSGSEQSLMPSSEFDASEAEFDVSFAPSATEGKIRVRIESPSEPSLTHGGSSPRSSLGSGSPYFAHTSPTESWDLDFAAPDHTQNLMWDSPSSTGANLDVSIFPPTTSTSRRRVRIALKGAPKAGVEGGEWEVEVR